MLIIMIMLIVVVFKITMIIMVNKQKNNQHSHHDHDDDVKVKDPGCRALISLTPEQQERAETIQGFVQATDNCHIKDLDTISQFNGHDKTENT